MSDSPKRSSVLDGIDLRKPARAVRGEAPAPAEQQAIPNAPRWPLCVDCAPEVEPPTKATGTGTCGAGGIMYAPLDAERVRVFDRAFLDSLNGVDPDDASNDQIDAASRSGFVALARLDREVLGRLVRKVWIEWAREQPSPKPSWLVPWEGLAEPDREVDRRIGETVARSVIGAAPVSADVARIRAILAAAPHGLDAQQIASGRAAPAERAREVDDTRRRQRELLATDLRGVAAWHGQQAKGASWEWHTRAASKCYVAADAVTEPQPTPPRALTEAEARTWVIDAMGYQPSADEPGNPCDLVIALMRASRGDVPPEVRSVLPVDYAARREAGEGGHGMATRVADGPPEARPVSDNECPNCHGARTYEDIVTRAEMSCPCEEIKTVGRPSRPAKHAAGPDGTCEPCSVILGNVRPCAISHDFTPGAHGTPATESFLRQIATENEKENERVRDELAKSAAESDAIASALRTQIAALEGQLAATRAVLRQFSAWTHMVPGPSETVTTCGIDTIGTDIKSAVVRAMVTCPICLPVPAPGQSTPAELYPHSNPGEMVAQIAGLVKPKKLPWEAGNKYLRPGVTGPHEIRKVAPGVIVETADGRFAVKMQTPDIPGFAGNFTVCWLADGTIGIVPAMSSVMTHPAPGEEDADGAARDKANREHWASSGLPGPYIEDAEDRTNYLLNEYDRLSAWARGASQRVERMREAAAELAESCSGGDHQISQRNLIAQRIRRLTEQDTDSGTTIAAGTVPQSGAALVTEGGARKERNRTYMIGVDIGGVISKYPDIMLPIMRALSAGGVEVHVVTDMPIKKALAMLALNDVNIPASRVHSCDYEAHGDACKAVKARELGLDMLWDDCIGYVSNGAPPVRMLVMPDGDRDYYHPSWKTDGAEGEFGRRLQRTNGAESQKDMAPRTDSTSRPVTAETGATWPLCVDCSTDGDAQHIRTEPRLLEKVCAQCGNGGIMYAPPGWAASRRSASMASAEVRRPQGKGQDVRNGVTARAAKTGCDGGHPGCSVCDALSRSTSPTVERIGVAVHATDKNGNVFLVFSSKDGRAWEYPGGKVHPGEGTRDAARRKFSEETGLDVTLSHDEPTELPGVPKADGAEYVGRVLLFRGRADGELGGGTFGTGRFSAPAVERLNALNLLSGPESREILVTWAKNRAAMPAAVKASASPDTPAALASSGQGGIYIASKAKHGPRWVELRDSGVPIVSTWIDESGEGQTSDWPGLWGRCIAEASSARALVMYVEEGEAHKGSLVEVGAALVAGVPVFWVGPEVGTIRRHRGVTVCGSLDAALCAASSVNHQRKESQ